MNKYLKRTLIFLTVIVTGLASFIIYGLYLIDIEDRYGDLQQIYFDAKSGDVIVNNLNGEIAVLEFKNRRMYAISASKKMHIDEWLDPANKFHFNVDIYRIKNSKEYLSLQKNEFKKSVEAKKVKLISHLVVKY